MGQKESFAAWFNSDFTKKKKKNQQAGGCLKTLPIFYPKDM